MCGYCEGKCVGEKECCCPCHFDPCPTCHGEGHFRRGTVIVHGATNGAGIQETEIKDKPNV